MNENLQDISAYNMMLDFWSNLEIVAKWMMGAGQGSVGPFNIQEDMDCPDSVKVAIRALNGSTYASLLSNDADADVVFIGDEEPLANDSDEYKSFGMAVEQQLYALDERYYSIFARRFFPEEPDSLRAIGIDLHVTGEQVRNYEKEIKSIVSPIFEQYEIVDKLVSLFSNSCMAIPISQAYKIFPELGDCLPGLQVPTLWIIRNYCKFKFEVKDGWIASPSIKDAQRLFKSIVRRASNKCGVVDYASISSAGIVDADGKLTDIAKSWAKYCGIPEYKGNLLACATVREQVAAILFIEQRPMFTEELFSIISPGGDMGNFRNGLYSSSLIMRVDVRQWALREWGMDEYSSVRQAIGDALLRNHGSMPYKDLIRDVVSKYSVSENSVVNYASRSQFTIEDGIISINEDYFNHVSSADPYKTRHLFRIDNGWAWRTTLDKRNSYSVYAPHAIAGILGIHHGERRFLTSPFAEQGVYWSSDKFTIGTVRRFINEGVVRAGEEVFYVFYDDGSFDLMPMRVLNGNAMHDALALTASGNTSNLRIASRYLGSAIGLSNTLPLDVLAARYQQRGDSDIADLLNSMNRILI